MWPSEKLMSLQGSGVVRGGGFIFRLCHIYAFPQRGSPAEFGWMNTLQCRFTLIKRCTLNQCTNPKLNYLEQKWK